MKSITPLFRLALGAATFATGLSAASFFDLTHGYDVFVKNDATLNGAHVHGSIATGGALSLQGGQSEFGSRPIASDYAILARDVTLAGSGQFSSAINANALRVGALSSDQTLGTNGLSDTSTGKSLSFQPGQVGSQGPLGVDFGNAFSALSSFSDSLRSLAPTLDFSTLIPDPNNWNYTIGNSGLVEVLNLTASQLASVSNMNFSAVASASDLLVINVDLAGFAGTFTQNRGGEAAADHIIWNFYGASTLSIQNQFVGSILAAELDLAHSNNDVKGMVIANSFAKTGGQVHVHRFDYDVPGEKVPDGGATAALIALSLPALIWARRQTRRG